MTCLTCNAKPCTYNLNCLECCARHVLMMFYPPNFDIRTYKLELAKKYNHDANALREKINEMSKKLA